MKVRIQHPFSDEELIAHALKEHPDCAYGEVVPGLTVWMEMTREVKLWRNEECALNEDPPRHTAGSYPPFTIEVDEDDVAEATKKLTSDDPDIARRAQLVIDRYNEAVKKAQQC